MDGEPMTGGHMSSASRQTLAAARERLDEYADSAQPGELDALSGDLFAVAALLAREPVLRRHLADSSMPAAARTGLLDRVLSGKVGQRTLEVLHPLVGGRWSDPADLVDGVETLARQAALALAHGDGSLDEVEDELFRFGRILDAQPRLRILLADPTASAERRTELLDAVLAGKVRPVSRQLLRQLVANLRGRNLERAVEELSNLAAGRRGRYIAHVQAAAPLSAEHERRLAAALSRIYRRQVALQVEVDPEVLGGLLVRVGDEIIDGTVAGRLAEARQQLAG